MAILSVLPRKERYAFSLSSTVLKFHKGVLTQLLKKTKETKRHSYTFYTFIGQNIVLLTCTGKLLESSVNSLVLRSFRKVYPLSVMAYSMNRVRQD